ncbi:alginate O-acetyltransferase [Candidatus Falkowbacteria bacterium RIFOXYB2_FULL_34_18]|uniref:Alginate O-acetyltransferase n=1 Tax=Candidatus Falkowbacteria bacterium RIFOXYD2_FULL_34_120 TaxID=1798007 RepID=A0A1F5TLR2_9BACT|nr:MAG: alginate O-acetyltransferase [Candidatus Falkowbacteria bacterium RIFOXYB2_FULL_34_18]OGF29737.1 MAG: alginate O-acetyltransferase [Candidatus Falkowbacteria bacterium RIFOXYC12_FULL_34_55]OGF37905.1 MAG: alginate O-acetyltransferase [Candidatus Falkowbacteria bacterium RIFOXYC2_FULL_34_220]OGF39635.1 MAG: alginate O-acetyltransferase [Candidatus Falkowbacteria bacterium RIFOXYD12_FULL_34_57]OGF39895.1 MAG: alginate O-acetyltransferase [Candidatus Falkowbacteria bacterium RIFOXYD2_FULL_
MLFNSLHFLIFFPLVVVLYFSIHHKYRWILLLVSSYYFYMSWKAEYIILIIISTLIDYFVGLKIEQTDNQSKRKRYLIFSLASNLGILFLFKYFNFFSDSFRVLLAQFSIPFNEMHLQFLLPVGISFYTFQTLSYTIDVYRRKIKAEKHLGIFAVYVSFFPQLVAGPIERAQNLLPQFKKENFFIYDQVISGLRFMLWGFFMKLVIADRLAIVVNQVYNNPSGYTGLPILLATYLFSYQIYCDFAGYSLIAIGAARIMGYDLMINFCRPYFAQSISEFWSRWHISLSTWFRDYLYIPLGGNRVAKYRWYGNLMIVFLVSGLWHGANWTFVVWGGLHGAYLVFSVATKKLRKYLTHFLKLDKFPQVLNVLRVVFVYHLVLISWIFFRANSLSDAFYILQNMFTNWSLDFSGIYLGGLGGWFGLKIALAPLVFLIIFEFLEERYKIWDVLYRQRRLVRWLFYIFILLWLFLFGVFEENDFLYFQF